MESVVRDGAWIGREYGQEKWPAVLDEMRSSDSTAEQLVHTIGMGNAESRPVRLGSSVVSLPSRLAVSGYLGWVAGCIADYAQSSDLIIELGAGWGRNLFLSWLHGANPDARYVAAEYTEAGRQAAAELAARCNGINLEAIPFDYHNPSIEGFEGVNIATVVTVHSIEQIPYLDRSVIELVRSIASEVVVLHFEPIGWQSRREGPSTYAVKHDYNRNLYDLLITEEVNIMESEYDVIGTNPDNPTSKIVWK